MTISALVLVLAVAGAAVAAQTRSAVAAPGPGSIVGVQSGRCVDVPNGSTTNGTQVQLYDCTGGTPQSWTYTSAKQLTVYGNKCLDANGQGTSPGTTVIIWDCNGQANQQWNITSAGTVTGQQSGLCLDATNAGTANGTRIILWTCNGQANQRWNVSTTPSSPPPTSTPPPGGRPCDIYAAGGTPCVAAHSTTRALFSAYGGNLYQVRRSSDNATRNIGLVSAGGYADAAAQDAFCSGTSCVITAVFDQSGRGNDLWYQGSAQVPGSTSSRPANATSVSLTVGGARAYSLYINPGNSYWR
ncbi:arabinofuranosidase catalytic domain-containing protein, partial [Micromonospora sp. NPDC052213]|uniref:arabinofuranosidase catalytic domain-containing protein n=1 Tax=Micromonospora sp. NPDC052213 TaxID=3155812 RepID=UPI003419E97F